MKRELIVYKPKKSDRWRWKFEVNNREVARSSYHYASPSGARKSFDSFALSLRSGLVSDSCVEDKKGNRIFRWIPQN